MVWYWGSSNDSKLVPNWWSIPLKMERAAANVQPSGSAHFFPLYLKIQIVLFCSSLLKLYRTYNELTHAVSHDLTLFRNITMSRRYLAKLYSTSVPLKSVPGTIWTKRNNSTWVIFSAPLKILWKAGAWIMILFPSASISTIQLQPSHQECCFRQLDASTAECLLFGAGLFPFLAWQLNCVYACGFFLL